MTREEHVYEAEKLLELAARESWASVGNQRGDKDQALVNEYVAVAQVHALLALAVIA